MDIASAYTESFVQFLDFHDAFNLQFKAAITAIEYVEHETRGPEGEDVRARLVARMTKNWRDTHNWTNTPAILRDASKDTTRLAIVQIHSALDDYAVAVAAEHERWCAITRNGFQRTVVNAAGGEDEPLWKLCAELGFDFAPLVTWRPLLSFFRVMRNCIAHASSKASRHLTELADAPSFGALLKKWPKRSSGVAPPVPAVQEGQPIVVHPKAVLLCLDGAWRACEHINRELRAFLGTAGFSYGAAYRELLDPDRTVLSKAYRQAQGAINESLKRRYRVKEPGDVPVAELQELGLWKACHKRHALLYRNSVKLGLFKVPRGFRLPT